MHGKIPRYIFFKERRKHFPYLSFLRSKAVCSITLYGNLSHGNMINTNSIFGPLFVPCDRLINHTPAVVHAIFLCNVMPWSRSSQTLSVQKLTDTAMIII